MQKEDPLKLAAEALAKATPDYAGQSAFPPLQWWMEGDELVVLCADGRKVRQACPRPSLPQAGRPHMLKPCSRTRHQRQFYRCPHKSLTSPKRPRRRNTRRLRS